MENEKLDELIDGINILVNLLSKPKVADNQELWDERQCAAYLGYGESNFRQRIACKPTFPKRIVLNPGGEKETKRWVNYPLS